MDLRIVGAGVGRTGTNSLKVALEQLLGAPCYHMMEVAQNPDHIPLWTAAAEGRMPDWAQLFSGYAAAVDWPVAGFWPEISTVFPDAMVVLSTRDPEAWWSSASETIFPFQRRAEGEFRTMVDALFASRFTPAIDDKAACIAAFERHNASVRAAVPESRLLEWTAGDGWAPICHALGLPVPDEDFPHTNTKAELRAMMELE